jgi:hypothetical protein
VKFETISYADISTSYLERSDLDLIGESECPGHLAELDGKEGDFFHTPHIADGVEGKADYQKRCKAYGLSDRFVQIMLELDSQEIRYVRFDSDGGEVEGLEYCAH